MQIRKDVVNNKWTIEFNAASVELLPDADGERCKFYVLNDTGDLIFADWFPTFQKAMDECWHYYTKGYWSWQRDE